MSLLFLEYRHPLLQEKDFPFRLPSPLKIPLPRVTLCSNKALPDGRGLPTAWIYSAVPLDD